MASDFQIDSTIARALETGHTLPARWYADDAVFEQEKRRIFHRAWQYVGHAGLVAKPGDFVTTRLGDIPVVITARH